MSKILVVFFDNFLKNDRGANSYTFNVCMQLKQQGHQIDYLPFQHMFNDFENFNELNQKYNLITKLYLYMDSPYYAKQQQLDSEKTIKFLGIPLYREKQSRNKIKRYILGIRYYLKARQRYEYEFLTQEFVNFFQSIIDKEQYDYVYIHYVQCAELVKYVKFPSQTKLVYQMHDAHYLQSYYLKKDCVLGKELDKELAIISKFDTSICISYDELWFTKKILPQVKFYFLPHPIHKITLPQVTKNIDIMFLGANHPYNTEGVKWFIEKVLPKVHGNINFTICGKVWKDLDAENYIIQDTRVKRIDFAEDLNELYSQTKVSVIPILRGTGMKIKTIDSMARQIPIVTTPLGVDGFPDKKENGILIAETAEQFADYVNNLLEDNSFWKTAQTRQTAYFAKYLDFSNYSTSLGEIFNNQK